MNERRPTPNPDDDEPEMEIVPMTAPPPAARPPQRRRSGLAEEPIESGEITDRRSLVIRSQPRVDVVPDPRLDARPSSSVEVAAEAVSEAPAYPMPAQVPAPMPVAPTTRRGWLWLVAALVVAGAGAATFAVKPTVQAINTDSLQATAALIGTTIDGEVRGLQVRAEAVATSSMLRAGIVTDAQTLADMARDKDFVFTVKPGETFEAFQIIDGKRTSLLRLPADATALDPPPVGASRLESHIGDIVAVTTTAKVATTEPTIGGEVALSAPIDLSTIRTRLGVQVEEAVISGLAIPVVLVKSTGVKGNVITIPVATTMSDAKLVFSAIVRPQVATSSMPQVRLGAFALAGLCALLFLVSLIRK